MWCRAVREFCLDSKQALLLRQLYKNSCLLVMRRIIRLKLMAEFLVLYSLKLGVAVRVLQRETGIVHWLFCVYFCEKVIYSLSYVNIVRISGNGKIYFIKRRFWNYFCGSRVIISNDYFCRWFHWKVFSRFLASFSVNDDDLHTSYVL